MSAAAKPLILVTLALAACSEAARDGQASNAAATDIEALPPDESSVTPAEELANGAAEPSNGNSAPY